MSEEQNLMSELVFPFLKLKLASLPVVFLFDDDGYSLLYGKDHLKAGLMIRILLFLGRLGTGRDEE